MAYPAQRTQIGGTFKVVISLGVALLLGLVAWVGGYSFGYREMLRASQSPGQQVAKGMGADLTTHPQKPPQPTALPSPSTVPTHEPSPPWPVSSVWSNTEGKPSKSLAYVNAQIANLTPPSGWKLLTCNDSINIVETDSPLTCATEPDAFIINVSANSPYVFQETKNNRDSVITDDQLLVVAGKPAEQYVQTFAEGPGAGTYVHTVVFTDSDAYIYITLNDPAYQPMYDQLLSSIVFK